MSSLHRVLLVGVIALAAGCDDGGGGGGDDGGGSGGSGGEPAGGSGGSGATGGSGGAGAQGGGPGGAGAAGGSGPCAPGTADCACADGDTCGDGLFCAGGVCRVPQCDLGDEGCTCFADDTCRTGPDGRPMQCVDGLCRVAACTAGTLDCGCAAMDRCDAGLFCQDGKCLELECTPGEDGCVCGDADACDEGLACEVIDPARPHDKRCVEVGCVAGSDGCRCRTEAIPCDEGLRCARGLCETCPAGAEGCACDDGDCGDGLVCLDAVCVDRPCTTGTEGCACGAGDRCGLNDRGEATTCQDDRCASDQCVPGDPGCACIDGAFCDDGAACRDGFCQPDDCAPGDEHCACAAGRCGDGLTCRAGVICADATGFAGGACAEGSVCHGGAVCLAGRCDVCVLGEEACACLEGDVCRGDLDCQANRCVPPVVERQRPANPRCYTPCEESFEDELGVFHRCAADGLMAGCLDDRTCREGSCLTAAEAPPTCDDDLDCPSFQACIAGGCYSDCVDDDDCGAGQGCHLRVCRDQCDGESDPCAEGYYCDSTDGAIGHCRKLREVDAGEPQTEVQGTIEVNEIALAFTSSQARRLFAITNRTASRQKVTVRKLSHVVYSADNRAESVQLDIDSDGVGTAIDVCPYDADPVQGNADGDERGDACDTDDDNDDLDDRDDNCPLVANADQADADGDGAGDACQGDLDGDTVLDARDNCPRAPNRAQADADNDDEGDDCEPVTELGCDANADCPLWWLELGIVDEAERRASLELELAAGATETIELAAAGDLDAVRWVGEIEVEHATLNRSRISLTYSQSPEGQWTGHIYYFASFGDAGFYTPVGASAPNGWVALDNPAPGSAPAQWTGTRDDASVVERVGNALIQRWSAFRRGRLTGGWDELQAVLTATQTESWKWSRVQNDCESAACYLYDSNRLGLKQYSSNLDTVPVPTGLVELPFALNLYQPDAEGAPTVLGGRIESSTALHYAGNPSISLTFDTDPTGCSRTVGGACMVFVEGLDATIAVGGRYETDAGDIDCEDYADGSYEQVQTPWLVPGFQRNTTEDANSGRRYRYSCRDSKLPFASGVDPAAEAVQNLAAAAANPVPDGRPRFRRLELVDGALINQSTLFVIFRERFDSFLDPLGDTEGFSAYGYMVLSRQSDNVDETDADGDEVLDVYEGSDVADARDAPDDLLAVSCSTEILSRMPGVNGRLTAANAGTVTGAILTGVVSGANLQTLDGGDDEVPHYLCLETGLIDGGPDNSTPYLQVVLNNDNCGRVNDVCEDGGDGFESDDNEVVVRCALGTDVTDCGVRYADDGDERVPCPEGSDIVYFTVDSNELSQGDIADLDCQQDGSCLQTVLDWRDNGGPIVQYPARWQCSAANRVYCSDDRRDLLEGKTFYAAAEDRAVFDPIRPEIAQAFRYKTRFRNRNGQQVGFAPVICPEGSEQVPYCYDADAIEDIRERVDCLIHIQQTYYANLTAAQRTALDEYLVENFSFTEEEVPGAAFPITEDGFERLYAELLVLQGDESVTRAFQSRFDLAGQNNVSFEGSLLEDGGIDLSGQAGYEMYSLYQGVQYYQEALDRFYGLGPHLWSALSAGNASRNFVTPETVTRYFDRLIRASTQKTQAFSEIARRYQSFNEPQLAREVIQRAYTGAYLESVVMSRMMSRVVEVAAAQDRAQISTILDAAQRRYRVALLKMRDVYSSITDEQTFMGVPPDYVPIPALDASDFRESNAFEAIFRRTEAKVQSARERENLAIDSNRAFQTDAAQFQAELVRIRNTYEDQLGNICGTFEVDGRVYPAIAKYAPLDDRLAAFGDPCGFVGNGQIHEAMLQFEVAGIDLRRIRQQYENVLRSVEIEQARVSDQCGLIFEAADFVYEQDRQIANLQQDIRWAQFAITRADRLMSQISNISNLTKCAPLTGECAVSAAVVGVYIGTAVVIEAGVITAELTIHDKEREIAATQRETARWQTQNQCQVALVDSNARVADMLLRLNETDLELLRQDYQIQLQLSELRQLHATSKRLQQQQAETEELAINVEAARNDPNVRVYRNDAIINADVTFDDALREAYRLTQVYEYYTSQSYADKDRLYFIRMVARGDDNLDNYLLDINNAFQEFQETYGLSDTRVMVVSLLNDVLAIPRIDGSGRALDEDAREELMHEALRNPENLDENGYLTLPFSTDLDDLSPLTRNHKVLNVRAEVIGNDFGDHVARIYLRQRGTGVIRGLDDGRRYYRMPERTAVLNPYFNGSDKVFADAIYTNGRLRDRPLVNTEWQLVINQRDEAVNQDVNLQSIDDIKLYVYYTDFTAF